MHAQIQYARDCKAVFGKLLAEAVPEARFLVAATERTVQLWQQRFPTVPYHHHAHTGSSFGKTGRRRIRYNLMDAVVRQSSFYYQVSTQP